MTEQTMPNDYDRRSEDLWASVDQYDEDEFRAKVEELVGELPADSPVAAFERACAFDSTGHSDRAVPLYRRSLELGLAGERRRRAVIQLASSLRNLDQVSESVALLIAEREQPSDQLDDAVSAFLALALVDSGREREAVSVALAALATHLPRYQRSLGSYARELSLANEGRAESPAVDLLELTEERHGIAERFWQLFLHDLSEFRGSHPDEYGAFKRRRLEPYLVPDPDRAAYVVYGPTGPIGFAFVHGLTGAVRRFDQFFIVRSQRRARLGRAAAEATVRRHAGQWEVGFQNENPVAAQFWRRLAAEIGSDVEERLRPVPDKPHIPDDVILSFNVS